MIDLCKLFSSGQVQYIIVRLHTSRWYFQKKRRMSGLSWRPAQWILPRCASLAPGLEPGMALLSTLKQLGACDRLLGLGWALPSDSEWQGDLLCWVTWAENLNSKLYLAVQALHLAWKLIGSYQASPNTCGVLVCCRHELKAFTAYSI